MLDYCTSDTIFMRPLCLQPAVVQICPSVLNGALLLEHNVAYYLERCSESLGSIHMDHCYCNAPLISATMQIILDDQTGSEDRELAPTVNSFLNCSVQVKFICGWHNQMMPQVEISRTAVSTKMFLKTNLYITQS